MGVSIRYAHSYHSAPRLGADRLGAPGACLSTECGEHKLSKCPTSQEAEPAACVHPPSFFGAHLSERPSALPIRATMALGQRGPTAPARILRECEWAKWWQPSHSLSRASQHSTDHSDHHRSRASEASPARAATPTAREPRTLSHTRGHPALRRVIGGQHVESPAACEWLHGGSADGKGGNYRGGLQSQRSVRLGWQAALSVRTPGRPSFHYGKPRTLMQHDRIADITQSGGPL